MLMILCLAAAAAAVTPQSVEAVSRAAAVAAGQNSRLDVVSALDVQDTIDLQAQKDLCGLESESCASQLADAYDARLVLFLRIYLVADEPHVALTLRDLKAGSVVHRSDVAGDDRALFAAVQAETTAMTARFTDHPAEGRTRLFVGRAAVAADIIKPAEAPPPPPQQQSPSPPGPSPLLIGGGVTAGVGLAGAIVAGLVAFEANGVIGGLATTGQEKSEASSRRIGGFIGLGAGGVLVGLGVGLAVFGSMESAQ